MFTDGLLEFKISVMYTARLLTFSLAFLTHGAQNVLQAVTL